MAMKGDKNMNTLIMLLIIWGVMVFSAFAQTGKIAGKLTYPGEGIPPDLVLCVKTAGGNPVTFCSNTRASLLRENNIVFKVRTRAAVFEISLPTGSFYLYATVPEMGSMKAYYNEFVKCGMSVDCKSKRLIAVKVRPGQTTRGITVGDWYD